MSTFAYGFGNVSVNVYQLAECIIMISVLGEVSSVLYHESSADLTQK